MPAAEAMEAAVDALVSEDRLVEDSVEEDCATLVQPLVLATDACGGFGGETLERARTFCRSRCRPLGFECSTAPSSVPASVSFLVEVVVEDTNDNTPQFTQPEYVTVMSQPS